MGALQLVAGKFLKDGEIMPAEFGNAEQIALLKKIEQYDQDLKEGMELYYDMDTTVEYSASIKCTCGGGNVHFGGEEDAEFKPKCLANQIRNCHKCKQSYKTYMENGELMIKKA